MSITRSRLEVDQSLRGRLAHLIQSVIAARASSSVSRVSSFAGATSSPMSDLLAINPGDNIYGWRSKYQSEPTEYVVQSRTENQAVVRSAQNDDLNVVEEPGRFVVVNPHTGDRPYSSDQEALVRAAAD